MKKFNFLKTIVLALILFAGIGNAWGAKDDLIYTLDLAAQNSAFGTSNSYGAKSGTVSGVTWYANAASCQSTANVWLGTNSAANRTNFTILSAGVNNRGGAIATALGIQTSTVGYYAIVGENAIDNVGTIKVKAGATGGTAPSTLWCLYTTDGGTTYTVLDSKSSPGTNEQTFIPASTITSAQYAFVFYSTAYGTYRTPYFKFYEGATGAPCTASNLAFADPTVNKSVVDAPFTITATSDNGTTDIVYSSTDTSVATVDAETGEVTIVGAGTTKIKADQDAGEHSGTDYCVGSAEYDLTVAPLAAPVATEATNAWKNRFFANWGTVTGATSYELNVYTKEGEGVVELLSEDFSSITEGNSTATSGSGTAWGGNTNFPTVDKAYQAGGAVKLGTSSATGSITTKELNLSSASTLSFDVKGWTTVEGDIQVSVDGDLKATKTYTAVMADSFENIIVELDAATSTSIVTIATTAKRAFLDNIIITSGSETITPISGSPFTVSGGGTNTYEVTGLTQMVQYYYTVKAKNGSFESAASNEVSAMIDMGTGVNNTAALSGISVQNGNLLVSATAGTLIEVYNIAGQKIVSQTAKEGVNTIAIAQRGAMIVKIGTETVKVVI